MVTRAFSPFEGLHGGLLTTARGTPRVWMVLGTGGSCGSQCGLLTADCPPSGQPGMVLASQTLCLVTPGGAVTFVCFNHKRSFYRLHAWVLCSSLKKKKGII